MDHLPHDPLIINQNHAYTSNHTSLLSSAFVLLATLFLFEQLRILLQKKKLPGPSVFVPFLGGLVEMVRDPQSFWERQDNYGEISYNYILGRHMFHTTDPELCRRILSHDNPQELKMKLHPNAEMILGENNIAFMQGPKHKTLRANLLPLFSRKALSNYLTWQDQVIRHYFTQWSSDSFLNKEVEFRPMARELNTRTSYRVFIGSYLDDVQMTKFSSRYQEMNEGFLTFPVNLPGNALNKAISARTEVVRMLTWIAGESKARMRKGEEPTCLLDMWMKRLVAPESKEGDANRSDSHAEVYDDFEVGSTVLDFLFAAQDASTSSLVWTMALMAEYPEVLEKVRQEQKQIRPNDDVITGDLVERMTYTRQVVREILRFRPPATFVPQEAQADWVLDDNTKLSVPKGSIIIPSLWVATKKGYSDPDTFNPDRHTRDREDYELNLSKNFLVFGFGSHACLGREYAINHLTAFLALISTHFNWTRRVTPISHKIFFGPTIYPFDCLITLSKRNFLD